MPRKTRNTSHRGNDDRKRGKRKGKIKQEIKYKLNINDIMIKMKNIIENLEK